MVVATKEPWEMTWSEWVDYWEGPPWHGMRYSFAEGAGKPLGIKSQAGEPLYWGEVKGEGSKWLGETGLGSRERWRKAIMRQALAQGKTVPSDALKDYPELKPKSETSKGRGTLVARYVERKISPSTGKDTDYVHEYRLVHDPSHKHGAYQIYRSLTVDGETRSDELYEYGDSPTHLAKRIPYETAYQKAEKFGVFKTVYDNWLATKEAEKRAGEQKEEAVREEGRRYEKILSELGTIKGAKRTTVQIASWSEGKPAKQDVLGYDVGNGVGIAIHGEGKYKSYTVTHLNSGLAMGDRRGTLREAIALAKAASRLTDWSKYKTDRDVPRNILDKTKDLVRGFTQKRIDEGVARDIEPKKQEKRLSPIQQYGTEVFMYGGFPLRRIDIIKDLEKQGLSPRERDAYLMGMSRKEPLEGVEPIKLEKFYEIMEAAEKGKPSVKRKEPKEVTATTHIQITRVQSKRSSKAQQIDQALLAAEVVPVEQAEKWLKRPNRYDIRGVDTPGVITKAPKPSRSSRSKPIRPALMTSSGRLVRQRRGSVLKG